MNEVSLHIQINDYCPIADVQKTRNSKEVLHLVKRAIMIKPCRKPGYLCFLCVGKYPIRPFLTDLSIITYFCSGKMAKYACSQHKKNTFRYMLPHC